MTCVIAGCPNPPHGRGYCSTHLRRLREGRPIEAPVLTPAKVRPPCAIPDCGHPSVAAATRYCGKHHSRYLRHGDPLTVLPSKAKGKPGRRTQSETCTAPGCAEKSRVRSLCTSHYEATREPRQKKPELARKHSRDAIRRNQAATLPVASRHFQPWSGWELEIAGDKGRTVRDAALTIGRTYAATSLMRSKIHRDPATIRRAGV